MNTKFVFKSILSIVAVAVLLISCDKDFTDVGGNLLDGNHFDFERDIDTKLSAYNVSTGIVQTNDVTNSAAVNINPLGIIKNGSFAKTKANFVTQLQLPSPTLPVIGKNPVIDSVVLSIPYFSTKLSTAADGKGTYELDSIYGDKPIKLGVYESGYYINNLDPSEGENFQSTLKFYNDDNRFENYRKGSLDDGTPVFNGPALNNSTNIKQNTAFEFSNKEIVLKSKSTEDESEVITRSAPAMRLELNKNYFQKRILDAPADKFTSQDRFKDHFRGLYFKIEQSVADPEGKGSLAMLNFTNGSVSISYTFDQETKDPDDPTKTIITKVSKILTLAMNGNRISLLEDSEKNTAYQDAIATTGPDGVNGDDKLYLKGGQGSMAVINLFGEDLTGDPITGLGNGIPDQLEEMRTRGWQINEANLTFYVDTENVTESLDAQRIYLYDLNNRRPLIDYYADRSSNLANPKKSKSVFGGFLIKETTGGTKTRKYKIRITNYINNLLNKDSTNVRLGLVVTEGIAEIDNSKLKTPVTLPDGFVIDRMPLASVYNPLGTILWGGTPAVPLEKRLKLEIFYTKQKP